MHHAACKVEFQPFNRSYSQLTLFNFSYIFFTRTLVQSRNRLLVRRWCSGHRVFARLIQQVGFWTQKIQANVDYCCYVRRRAECTSLGPGFKHPSLRSESSLAAKRRAEALHVVFLFNKASEPSTRGAAALCTLA